MHKVETVIRMVQQSLSNVLKSGSKGPPSDPKILQSISSLTAEDFRLSDAFAHHKVQAPMSYIEVFEGSRMSVGIFVLHPGTTIPLHDHPNMFGILKVLDGEIGVRSFSSVGVEDKNGVILAEAIPPIVANSTSPPLTLSPSMANYHEIQFLKGGKCGNFAAFIDFLAPPYSDEICGQGDGSTCTYYKTLDHMKEGGKDFVRLCPISVPNSFYNDQVPYKGPLLKNTTQ